MHPERLRLEDEVGADLVDGAGGSLLAELDSVEGNTEGRLHTWAESLGVT